MSVRLMRRSGSYAARVTRRIGRGGRKGQTHTATPSLRLYSVPPASPVTVTRPDGTTEIIPARKPQATQKAKPKRGPLVCAMCGGPTDESPTMYSRARGTRGKPVHSSCDPTATQARPQRPPQQRKKTVPSTPTRGSIAPGADPATAWTNLACPQCRAGRTLHPPLQRRHDQRGRRPPPRAHPGGQERPFAPLRKSTDWEVCFHHQNPGVSRSRARFSSRLRLAFGHGPM